MRLERQRSGKWSVRVQQDSRIENSDIREKRERKNQLTMKKRKKSTGKRLMRLERQRSGKWSVRVQQDSRSEKSNIREKRERKKSLVNEKEINVQRKRLMRQERQGSGKRSVRVQQDSRSINEGPARILGIQCDISPKHLFHSGYLQLLTNRNAEFVQNTIKFIFTERPVDIILRNSLQIVSTLGLLTRIQYIISPKPLFHNGYLQSSTNRNAECCTEFYQICFHGTTDRNIRIGMKSADRWYIRSFDSHEPSRFRKTGTNKDSHHTPIIPTPLLSFYVETNNICYKQCLYFR